MKTVINIRNLTITLPNQGESVQPEKRIVRNRGAYQPLTKETSVDGVYIYTKNGNLWLPQFWGLSDEVAESVVVIQGDKKRCVSLKGSTENMIMLDSDKRQTGKCFESSDRALSDWDGRKNTEELLTLGSPAAKYCKELGEKWYIPSLGELSFLQENRSPIDAALTICDGEPLFNGWHWTSTRMRDNCDWVLYWSSGDWNVNRYQLIVNRVRPVSAFL